MDFNHYELVLVSLSFSITIGYHIFLWRSFKSKGKLDRDGENWLLAVVKDQEKKGMLGVQGLRNTLMAAILSCTIAIILNIALAAMWNNAYGGRRLLHGSLFIGHQLQARSIALKYCISSLLILSSFVSSSIGVAQLIDVGFLLNVPPSRSWSSANYEAKLALGCLLAAAGNRLLFVAIPLLFWMLGPTALVLSSVGVVWLLYGMDFPGPSSV